MVDATRIHAAKSDMLTGPQIRAARALLNWSGKDLAAKAGLSWATVQRAEAAAGVPRMETHNMMAIQGALEGAGIVFIDPGEQKPGGHGVRFTG